jgi:hypothetical protein
MKSLGNPEHKQELVKRIQRVQPSSKQIAEPVRTAAEGLRL